MEFNVNHPILFVFAAVIILAVLGQSFFFLFRAYARAKERGMDMSKVKKTITSAALFTVAPAVSILVGVLVLSKKLGVALPWLRLSIIGSLSYETVAAETTIDQLGLEGTEAITASGFVTVLWVMTLGIIIGLALVPIFARRIQKGIKKMEKKDTRWGARGTYVYDFGDDLPMVNAAFLKDIMDILPDAKAYATNNPWRGEKRVETSGIIFRSEAGDALLLPVRKMSA